MITLIDNYDSFTYNLYHCLSKRDQVLVIKNDMILKNIDKFKKDLFNFRFQKISSQVTKPAKISETKKSIARLKTVLRGKNA